MRLLFLFAHFSDLSVIAPGCDWRVTDHLLCTPSQQEQFCREATECKHRTLDRKELRPNVRYTVKVQAKMCDGNLYEGPWSEWSPAVEWRTRGADETESPEGCHFHHFCHLGPVGEPLKDFKIPMYVFSKASLSLLHKNHLYLRVEQAHVLYNRKLH